MRTFDNLDRWSWKNAMHYREFGPKQVKISEVGLGCWQLGGDWTAVSDGQANEILQNAVEQGITFFDTADVYGGGRSEMLIGAFFRKNPADVFIATKAGRMAMFPDRYTREGLKSCITDSIRRLQRPALDLVQMHCIPFDVMQQGEVWTWLSDFKKEGLIREYGASVETMEEADWCLDQVDELASLQIIFNIFRQKPMEGVLDKASQKQVGILARLPLASGLLSGKMKKNTQFAESDHRNYNANGDAFNVGETFAGIPFEKGVELAEALEAYREPTIPMAMWSLRWILDHPAVSTIIPGASRAKQVVSNAMASSLMPLSHSVHSKLREFYQNEVHKHIRGPY